MTIDRYMDQQSALEWASRRWECVAVAAEYAHPTSIGDRIAILLVVGQNGQQYRGIGYSGIAPQGVSIWAKAVADLLRQEPDGRQA